jgi:topoisomerase IV subunit A
MAKREAIQGNVVEASFAKTLSDKYLAYALSTIMARSLPDVRDGLKPVHRRLLYAMRLLKLDPGQGFKKCARVVGDVIGKYHPHGDQAVYDALVRLAQAFAVRYPLIDGQGNFGNIDGDFAAAMRYTEARLTETAKLLMDGLEEESVDFRETYDGEDHEPVVFPAGFPNLLANGATGIAVGMATSIPPHNAAELCEGLSLLIGMRLGTRKQLSTRQLVERIKGPDFPTGGVVVEPKEAILAAYETGRGSFRLRARWEKENLGRGNYAIVITEIPYQVAKSKLIERIAALINERKLPILANVRDESTEDVRIVLEPKTRNVEADQLMETLYHLTELEVRIPLNLNVLDKNRTPRVMPLAEALDAYLDHRFEVLKRRTTFRLGQVEHRMELLKGYLVVYLNLDKVIRIIRTEDEPKPKLMKAFKLSDVQAEAILNMRLRALRTLEEMEIRREHRALEQEKLSLKDLLKRDKRKWQQIQEEIDGLADSYGPKTALGKRRTSFADAPAAEVIPLEAMVEKEPITVIGSKMGWVRAMKGHVAPNGDVKYKEGDEGRFFFHAQTTDKLLIFATNGRFYTLGADKLPSGRGFGEPLRLMIDLDAGEDIVAFFPYVEGAKVVVASDAGKGFVAAVDGLLAQTRYGKQVMNVKDKVKAKACAALQGDHLAVLGENRKLVIYPVAEVPELARGQGVKLQAYREGGLADIKTFTFAEGLSWTMGGEEGRTRTETDLKFWLGKRGQAGRLAPKGLASRTTFE